MGAAQDKTKSFFTLPTQQTRTVEITLLVRIFQAEDPALSDAVVKWTVRMMNEAFWGSIAIPYTQPECSTSISKYCLSAYITRVCVLPESVVTDTLTSEVGLLKSNGGQLSKVIFTMRCIVLSDLLLG